MRFNRTVLSLGLSCITSISPSYALDTISPKQFLLEQVLTGEVNYRDDLVKQALARLELIAPNDPEVIAAQLRLSLRKKDPVRAQQLLKKLSQLSPDSPIYHQAQMDIKLSQAQGKKTLQQARLLAAAGNLVKAKALYDSLFQDNPPPAHLAVEYWTLMSRIPDYETIALKNLQSLYGHLQENKSAAIARSESGPLQYTLSGLSTAEANKALKAGNLSLAEQKFQQAFKYDPSNQYAIIGLGDVAVARKDFVTAERVYKKAMLLSPNGSIAIYGLVNIYKRESLHKALDYLNSLPASQQFQFKETNLSLQTDILQQEAKQFEEQKQWSKALAKYQEAYKISANEPWLNYHLARLLFQTGQKEKANNLLLQLVTKQSQDPQLIYIYALYLTKTQQDKRALAYINTIPQKFLNSDIRELMLAFNKDKVLEQVQIAVNQAQKMREGGDKKGAIAFLEKQAQRPVVLLKLGDWSLEDGDFTKALSYYRRVKLTEPLNSYAILGEIEALIAADKLAEALQQLQFTEQINKAGWDLSMQRRLATAWIGVHQLSIAKALFQDLKQKALSKPPSQTTALIFRNAAGLEKQLHKPQQAKADYAMAMVKSDITSTYPSNDKEYTFLTRNQAEDDWLKRGIRADAAELYRQQESTVTVEHDTWNLAGTGGPSALSIEDVIMQAEMPLYDGRLFLRSDIVNMNAGDFIAPNGYYYSDFGTCTKGCFNDFTQKARGYGFAAGWKNSQWRADVGETPVGFDVVNTVGSLNYTGDFHHIGWTLGVSSRPINNSLLSLAGSRDPNTGIVWGGVVARGANLSLSYDRGEAIGLWAYVDVSRVTGKNVSTNGRIRLMEGNYYKLINEENRRATIGINTMYWHYQKNLDGFSLGQGGYFSPQKFLSFALPIDYRQRNSNWSYELGGSVTWSRAVNQGNPLYPLPELLPTALLNQNPYVNGNVNEGLGYTLLALVERRLGSHFTCGAVVDIQRTRDYTPSHVSLYLRYSLDGWMGDLDMPAKPLIPYAIYS